MAGVSDSNAFRAGSFILSTLVLVGGIVWFVSGRNLFGGGVTRAVGFALNEDVAGIDVGAPVRVGGKAVGEVVGVDFGDDFEQVVLTIRMPSDVPVREGAVVRVQTTLTGVAVVNFTSLGEGEPVDVEEQLDGQGGDLNDVIRSFARLGPVAEDALGSFESSTLPNIDRAFLGIADAAARVDDAAGTLETTLQGDLQVTLANLRTASERLPKLADDAQTLATTAIAAVDELKTDVSGAATSLVTVLEKADQAAKDITSASGEARRAVTDVRALIAGNRGQVKQIVDRLADTSRTLDLASQEIRRSPWRLLFRPDGRQRESLNLYDAARQFAEGASALEDAAVALEGATADPTAEAADVEAILKQVRASFDKFERAERSLFEKFEEE